MSYQDSLVAAGARVIAFQEFGDWQGSYGSCDVCDAFQSEFDWDSDFACEDVQSRLAQFGRGYLDDLQTTDQVLLRYDADSSWDSDSEDAAFWVRETVQTYGV